MKYEKACGAVVYKIDDVNNIYVLLVEHNKGHFSHSKGHVENNESEVQTALREIKEETNLDVNIDTNFRKVITYNPSDDITKDVVFFCATPIDDNYVLKPQPEEIASVKWYVIKDAISKVTYASDRDVLLSAIRYIKGKYNI